MEKAYLNKVNRCQSVVIKEMIEQQQSIWAKIPMKALCEMKTKLSFDKMNCKKPEGKQELSRFMRVLDNVIKLKEIC